MKPYFLLMAAALYACSSNDEPKSGGAEINLEPQEIECVKTQSSFAFKFFKEAMAQSIEPNLIVSPLSASMCMSLVANGTAGDTQQEILTALGFGESELKALNGCNSKLSRQLPGVDRKTKISLANSIWLDNTISAKTDFINVMSENYSAEFYTENLSSDAAMFKINRWASDKTSGMIPQFLDEPLKDTRIALINALYFKSEWAEKFDRKNTTERVFHSSTGEQNSIPMMKGNVAVRAAHDSNGAGWVRIGYGNGRFAMILILPDENVSLGEYLASIDNSTFSEMTSFMKSYEGTIVLPKFDISCKTELKEVMKSLGIVKAFGDADFSPLSEDMARIDRILQKTHITVNEEGAEIAAVTGSGLTMLPEPAETAEFIFDHPFAFIVHERSSDTILFMGCINKL